MDHPALIQEWKLNLDIAAQLNNIDKNKYFRQRKKKLIGTIANNVFQKLLLKT